MICHVGVLYRWIIVAASATAPDAIFKIYLGIDLSLHYRVKTDTHSGNYRYVDMYMYPYNRHIHMYSNPLCVMSGKKLCE